MPKAPQFRAKARGAPFTVLYGALGTVNNRNGSQYALGSGTAQQPAGYVAAGNPRSTTATVGIRHSF